PGTAAHFIVQIYLGEKVVASKRVDAAEVKVKDLLAKLIPGEYQLRIITVDQNGIASTPSAPLTIVWVGSGLG
ncbi:MAG: hypothetical protein ACXW32_10710, partial [Limisphaerales bacterium]